MSGVTVKFRLPEPRFVGGRSASARQATAAASPPTNTAALAVTGADGLHARALPRTRVTSSLAQRLALAHYIEQLVEAGTLKDCAEAARFLGVSRASVSQVMDLLLVPTRDQEAILIRAVGAARWDY